MDINEISKHFTHQTLKIKSYAVLGAIEPFSDVFNLLEDSALRKSIPSKDGILLWRDVLPW